MAWGVGDVGWHSAGMPCLTLLTPEPAARSTPAACLPPCGLPCALRACLSPCETAYLPGTGPPAVRQRAREGSVPWEKNFSLVAAEKYTQTSILTSILVCRFLIKTVGDSLGKGSKNKNNNNAPSLHRRLEPPVLCATTPPANPFPAQPLLSTPGLCCGSSDCSCLIKPQRMQKLPLEQSLPQARGDCETRLHSALTWSSPHPCRHGSAQNTCAH